MRSAHCARSVFFSGLILDRSDPYAEGVSVSQAQFKNDRSVHRIHTRSVHDVQYSLLTSTNMKCVLRIKIVGHPVSHVIPVLVSTSPSLFQSTTRSTWTARLSPRRHCTPRTSSKNCMVGKEPLSHINFESCRKPANKHSHRIMQEMRARMMRMKEAGGCTCRAAKGAGAGLVLFTG